MFGFLRRKPRFVPIAPLLAADWDGTTLTLRAQRGTSNLALDLDGSFFTEASCDQDGVARFEFAFPPNGRAGIDAMPRASRDGAQLAAAPLRLLPGQANAEAAASRAASPRWIAAGAKPMPFGTDAAAPDVAIVVPVFNASELVARCLDSVLAHTFGKAQLIVIDDASDDAAIAPLLARYAHRPRVRVLHNDSNRGFTATANRGIAAAGHADVVLLNADTQVGPNWLQGLRRAAYSDALVATATAVSDNAGAFSVPELERENAPPAPWSSDDTARALWQQAGLAYPELPTGNGFCLYIRRSVIDAIGVLDEAAFPRGYGEENDFCQRAAQHGLRHVIAGNVHVGHARSASFGAERRAALGRAGMAVLRERWPNYESDVGRTLFSFERRVLDWRVRRAFARAGDGAPKPRLLWVGAGAPAWPDAEVWNLQANGSENELLLDGSVIAANTWQAHDPEPSYRALWDWLQVFSIERLVVARRAESAAEILCRLLDIPIAEVATPFAATASEALADGERALHSFTENA